MFRILVIARVDSLIELLVDCNNDVERSLSDRRRVLVTLQQIHLRQNQHLRASDEGVKFVLLGLNNVVMSYGISKANSPCTT